MSLSQAIKNRIKQKPNLWVFSAADFVDLGSRTAAEKVLSRSYKSGLIDRVTQGLYMRPYISPTFGLKAVASLDDVVNAISRRDNVAVVNSSTNAANSLKLTNVVQVKPVYLTTGKSRVVHVGQSTIVLKNMGGKLGKWVDSPAFTAVQALYWLGNKMLTNTPPLRDRFWNNIGSQAQADLIKNKNKLPMWAQAVIGQ